MKKQLKSSNSKNNTTNRLCLPKPNNMEGYTYKEIKSICRKLKVKIKDFTKKFGVATCPVLENGELGYYPWDVELAITCCLEKREKTVWEWD